MHIYFHHPKYLLFQSFHVVRKKKLVGCIIPYLDIIEVLMLIILSSLNPAGVKITIIPLYQ